ncbi:hypothetical protein HPB51_007474 [Rhipicephalus microplus]|uniref:Endonuclease/exonuclease/phosphatase domain-containing protein n=1 Tax=Rhipicephalus microplus TaxID=6941 RepID=A0A9J6D8P9_RHIMP|nr:hypothetical protein HPB51_007474 [Rhipicephalus microplus]
MATDADKEDNGTPTNIAGNAFVNTTTPKIYQFTAKAKTPTRASMVAAARGLEEQPEEELESESNEEEDDSASVISVAATNHGNRTKPLGYGSFSKKIGRNARSIKKWGKSFEGLEQRILMKCTQVLQQQLAQTIQLQIEQALERAVSPEKLQPLIGEAKDLAKRGDAAAVICGDFNAQHRELGYTTTTSKGRDLLEDAGEAEFTLLINPAHPSKIGTSASRDTNPDLTFAMLPEGGTAKWRNTKIHLGSDHFIIKIELPLAHLNGNPNRGKTSKHKLVDWSKFRNTELGEVDNIDECQADGQLHQSGTWKLLRLLMNETKRCEYQRTRMAQILHTTARQLGKEEMLKRLNERYLPITSREDHPDYAGQANPHLDRDLEEWEVNQAVQDFNCRSAAGPNSY